MTISLPRSSKIATFRSGFGGGHFGFPRRSNRTCQFIVVPKIRERARWTPGKKLLAAAAASAQERFYCFGEGNVNYLDHLGV